MQKNRKLFSTAIVTLLLLSIVASAAPAFAQVDVFTVNPTTATGTVGSALLLTYTHASYGGQVIVYWETQAGTILNQAYADGAGTAAIWVIIPAGAAGPHSIVARDISTGSTATTTFTITPKITLTPNHGLAGDSVTVTGSGFTAFSTLASLMFSTSDLTPVTTVSISALGAFVATITVPSLAYGTYNVVATDAAAQSATAQFVIGATFTASESKGPTGTIITVTGRGFDASTDITWRIFRTSDATTKTVPEVVNIVSTTAGTFTGRIVVPTVPKSGATDASVYSIEATDGTNAPVVRFNVTYSTAFTVDPVATSPWQNTVVTINGNGYTQLSGTEITFTFNGVSVGVLTTTSTGAVVGEIPIPNLTAGYYDFIGTDEYGLTYTLSYQIGITLLVLNPTQGPTGTVVTYYAYGFHDALAVNITLNGIVVGVIASPTNVGGRITSTFQVPTMAIGTYEVKITATDGLNAIATFVVTATTGLTPNPSQAPILSQVQLTATNFGAGTALTFYFFNSTWGTTLTMTPATGFVGTTTNGSGLYIGTFAIPATWTNGIYTIVANNSANTLNATTTFTVGSATFTVETRASTYNQGDFVSFKISSSYYSNNVVIVVTDPEGYTGNVTGETTELFGGVFNGYYYCSPCWEKFQLASDVPLGIWTWNASDSYGHVRTGSFTVTAKIGSVLSGMDSKLDTIISSIEDLNATLVDISGDMVTIKAGQTTITTSISNLPSTLTSTIQTSITNGLATITTSLGSITTKLNSLEATITSIDADVVTLSTSVGVVLTTLDDISAVVCDIQDDVATISTDLGVIQGKVTNIEGSIATITTGFGNVEMDVSELQADVTSTKASVDGMNAMVYVAAAFAIIAAIAAIASILLMRKKIAS